MINKNKEAFIINHSEKLESKFSLFNKDFIALCNELKIKINQMNQMAINKKV